MRTSLSAAKKARTGKSAGPAIPDGAERAGLPLALAPQLATLVEAPPDGPRLDLRGEVRRLPRARAHRRRRRAPLHAQRQRLERAAEDTAPGRARPRHRFGVAGRRDRGARRPGPAQLPAPAARFRRVVHAGHRLLRVRPALLRRLRPAARAAGGAARAAAARARRQRRAARALQRGFRPARGEAPRGRLRHRPRGPHRQARRRWLHLHALDRVGEDQVHAAPGVRRVRLHRSQGKPQRASARCCSACTTTRASCSMPATSAPVSTPRSSPASRRGSRRWKPTRCRSPSGPRA